MNGMYLHFVNKHPSSWPLLGLNLMVSRSTIKSTCKLSATTGNSTFYQTTKFEPDQLEAFADNKLNFAKMMISISNSVENIVGKGENAGYQHFLLFPQFFQKLSFLWSLKVGIVW